MNKEQKRMEEPTKKIIGIDDREARTHLRELVRGSVEETLNGLLDAEADALCGAKRYEHSPKQVDSRAGRYQRNLETQAGKVALHILKLRTLPLETQIIERYRRRESSQGKRR